MKSQIGEPMNAIEMNSDPRRMSQITITLRRSNRSASTPPIGREQDAGQQLRQDDQREREGLPLVAVHHLGDQTGQREQ